MTASFLREVYQDIYGAALRGLGHGLRRVSNRLTTFELHREYSRGAFPQTLFSMLAKLSPQSFGEKEQTVFVCPDQCARVVDAFLAKEGCARTPVDLKQFRNGESYARITETVRGKRVVLFHDFSGANIYDQLMECMLLIDSAKRASAKEVVLVCPRLPYIKDEPGSPNFEIDFFKLTLNLLFKASGLDKLRMGEVVLTRDRSLLLLQDVVFSHYVAPVMLAMAEKYRPAVPVASPALVFMGGKSFAQPFEKVVNLLEDGKLIGDTVDLHFVSGYQHALNLGDNVPREILRGKTVYIFATCNTGRINQDFFEALLMAYTARKTGAQEVVMVMPYLPYNRQERKANAHDPISAKVVAKALAEAAGVTRLISLDLHAAATEGFFDVPMQHITAQHLLVEWIRQNMSDSLGDMVPVAPDAGRAKATKKLGEELGLNAPPATVNKFRPRPGVAAVTGVVGNVSGKTALLYDDIIDTGGSILGAAQALITAGARQVCVVATHGVFAAAEIELDAKGQTELARIKTFLLQPGKREGDYIKYSIDGKKFFVNALVRLQADPNIHRIVFTDSLFCPPQNIIDEGKVAVVSISCLLAEVCARIIRNQTLVDIQYAS